MPHDANGRLKVNGHNTVLSFNTIIEKYLGCVNVGIVC